MCMLMLNQFMFMTMFFTISGMGMEMCMNMCMFMCVGYHRDGVRECVHARVYVAIQRYLLP